MSLNRQVLVVTLTLISDMFLLKEAEEPRFVAEAISELLRDNCVKEIFAPPDIINPLSGFY